MSEYDVIGEENLLRKLGEMQHIDMSRVLLRGGMVVLRRARENVTAKVKGEYTTGRLKNSIQVLRHDSDSCEVGTNVFYAPYVEFGTGRFSTYGAGRKGWWVYVKGSDGSVSTHGRREYTKAEAKRIMAMLCAKGLDAHMTEGREPKPFLKPALDDNREEIARAAQNEINKELRQICLT